MFNLDAYSIRKAVPRILIAVIGINISIFVCVALVDIVNVVSGGLARLIAQPFTAGELNSFGVPLDASSAVAGGVGVYVGGAAATSAISAAVGAIGTVGVTAITGALGALFFMLLPVVFLAIAILCVVILRQALLFFLIVISPVAIAFYVLPGTEKYFQRWWDIFSKTLLVYPIIAIMFAVSDVFASIIFSADSNNIGIATIITGIVVIYAPLFLIPFAFKLAGGAISALANFASGAGSKLHQTGPIKGRREYYGERTKDNLTRGAAEQYRRAGSVASDTRRTYGRRKLAAWRANRISGYRADVLDREAALNKKLGEQTADITGHGDDALQRAYTVDKEAADRSGAAGEGKLWKIDDNGQRQYRTAGGKWVSEFDVDESRRKYGRHNTTQLQQSLAYEMRKASSQEEQDNIVNSFGQLADSWGLSDDQTNGVWIGAGFANQSDNLQWKYGRWSRDNATGNFTMSSGGDGIIKEIDEKKGVYEAGRYNADTWTTMGQEVEKARRTLNGPSSAADKAKATETIQRAARIADSITQRVPLTQPDGTPTLDAAGNQMYQESVGAGAAPRTAEEMRAFSRIATAAGKGIGFDPKGYGTDAPRQDTDTSTQRASERFPGQSIQERHRPRQK